MVSVYPILSLLIVFGLSLLVIRTGSVALRMTGISPDVASFQSLSAFSGAGYTTDEAELVASHPQRRGIVVQLMRLGNVGLVGSVASLVLSFTNGQGGQTLNLVYVLGGVGLLVLLARSRWFNRLVTPIIERSLDRTTDLEIRDYTRVLGLQEDYGVAEIEIEAGSWLTGGSLRELDLFSEGVLVLAIEREDGTYVGAPRPETEIHPGDTVVIYGEEHRLRELSARKSGDTEARERAVEAHEATLDAQERSGA